MNYIFGLLSEKVNFLYGSIHAVRRKDFIEYSSSRFAPDTEAGLEYVKRGKKIAFLKDLEVVHLKEYNLRSFIKNDFYTSSAWAKLFFGKRGFKQLFKHKSGFAHSPKKQLGSVILAPLIIVLLALSLFSQGQRYIGMVVLLCIGYGVLNADLFRFMYKKRGAAFLWKSMIVTFVDNSIMFLGILHGFILVLGRRGVYAKA
jgi:hypothetical protein